ncbi:uncharacterized protein G2W53_024247 [Senna tora]|uniref:Uncharacterized protein n=1 Tax=Senna tora TaxID=362788 RepID=A0A834TD86_9FABA|nr:uncharacterized protein G2W53_024247 [Senna tora]
MRSAELQEKKKFVPIGNGVSSKSSEGEGVLVSSGPSLMNPIKYQPTIQIECPEKDKMQDQVVQVMKNDGKILEYKAPIQVHQVLAQFSGHSISVSSPPLLRRLHPNTKLLAGHLYYLVSPPSSSSKSPKKKVRFADPQAQEESSHDEASALRVKLVITKHQLQDMLQKGGISVNSILSLVQTQNKVIDGADLCHKTDDGFDKWKPALQTIPELI